MKLTKEQLQTLRLIDNKFQKLEQVSKNKGVNLNKLDNFLGYGFPNFADEQEKQQLSKNKTRQEVFEKSKKSVSQKDKTYSGR